MAFPEDIHPQKHGSIRLEEGHSEPYAHVQTQSLYSEAQLGQSIKAVPGLQGATEHRKKKKHCLEMSGLSFLVAVIQIHSLRKKVFTLAHNARYIPIVWRSQGGRT